MGERRRGLGASLITCKNVHSAYLSGLSFEVRVGRIRVPHCCID